MVIHKLENSVKKTGKVITGIMVLTLLTGIIFSQRKSSTGLDPNDLSKALGEDEGERMVNGAEMPAFAGILESGNRA